MNAQPAAVIILAAGEGTRMKSRIPKVLHPLAGRSLLGHVVHTARNLAAQHTAIVVRHARDEVAAHAQELMPDIVIADQDDIPGTGRAVQCGLAALDADSGSVSGPVIVMAGDVPLLDAATLQELLAAHIDDGNAVTLLSTHVSDPHGYGRVLRNDAGDVVGIVEEKDATEAQRAISEVNTSVYVFDAAMLREALGRVGTDNAQGEVYLTDVIALAHNGGKRVAALAVDDEWLVAGVNNRLQLAELGVELNRRILSDWMLAGVSIVDPGSTWIDVDVELETDVTLLPGTHLAGRTRVGEGATIGPDTTLRNVDVGAAAQVVRCHGSDSRIGAGATVGPFAYLRPGVELGEGGKIGTFVEVKNSVIGRGSKVPHLSYVGDGEIGEGTNIGAGTIFVNYDGVKKQRTRVGDHARTGADNKFVAPVTIGDGAYTGAGTVVRRDVPPGALGITVAQQRNIERWVLHNREGTAAAGAATAALGDDGVSESDSWQEPAQPSGDTTKTGGRKTER